MQIESNWHKVFIRKVFKENAADRSLNFMNQLTKHRGRSLSTCQHCCLDDEVFEHRSNTYLTYLRYISEGILNTYPWVGRNPWGWDEGNLGCWGRFIITAVPGGGYCRKLLQSCQGGAQGKPWILCQTWHLLLINRRLQPVLHILNQVGNSWAVWIKSLYVLLFSFNRTLKTHDVQNLTELALLFILSYVPLIKLYPCNVSLPINKWINHNFVFASLLAQRHNSNTVMI